MPWQLQEFRAAELSFVVPLAQARRLLPTASTEPAYSGALPSIRCVLSPDVACILVAISAMPHTKAIMTPQEVDRAPFGCGIAAE